MHLKSLRIKNFRLLQRLEVEKLGRLNLIVGRNNCGKSTVLEALRIYAGDAHRELLEEISAEHDEQYKFTGYSRDTERSGIPFEHFFTGRKFPEAENGEIYIGEIEDQSRSITIKHIYFVDEQEEYTNPQGEKRIRTIKTQIPKSSITSRGGLPHKSALKIQTDGEPRFLEIEQKDRSFSQLAMELFTYCSCSFVSTKFASANELADIWDEIVVEGFDYIEDVKAAMQIIDANYEELIFIKREKTDTRIAIIKLKNEKRAYPLNSMGDGMLRILQIILKAAYAQNGFLLIDELENGLHYSVQEKLWNLLFELAEKFNIQVFAATHSWDCIESFAKVAKSKPEAEAVLFRLGRSIRTSDQGRIIATVFDGEQLASLTQADVEVR